MAGVLPVNKTCGMIPSVTGYWVDGLNQTRQIYFACGSADRGNFKTHSICQAIIFHSAQSRHKAKHAGEGNSARSYVFKNFIF